MVDVPFLTWSHPLSNAMGAATESRTMPERMTDVLNVKDFGAKGDGTHNDTLNIQACFDAAFGAVGSDRSFTNPEQNHAVYFPAGVYIVTGNPALKVKNLRGSLIYGAGMVATFIRGQSANAVTWMIDGMEMGCVRDLCVQCSDSGGTSTIGIDFDGNQSDNNLFINVAFYGGTSGNANGIGMRVGHSNSRIDTTSYINCFMGGNKIGWKLEAQNGLDHQFWGCASIANEKAIWVQAGGVSVISGCYFGANSVVDIDYAGGGNEGCSISGCRSESHNFLTCGPAAVIHIDGCHTGNSEPPFGGHFVSGGTNVSIDSCWPSNQDVFMSSGGQGCGNYTISNCNFNRYDALDGVTKDKCSTFVRNCLIGGAFSGIGRFVPDQDIIKGVVRTKGVEVADVTSDLNFLYDNWLHPSVQDRLINSGQVTTGAGSVTFTSATPTLLTFPDHHWFSGGEAIAFTVKTGTLPSGIVSGRVYFVTNTPSLFQHGATLVCNLSTTKALALAGTADVNTTSTGSGTFNTWHVRRWEVGDEVRRLPQAVGSPRGWVCTTAGWATDVTPASGEVKAVFTALPNL